MPGGHPQTDVCFPFHVYQQLLHCKVEQALGHQLTSASTPMTYGFRAAYLCMCVVT